MGAVEHIKFIKRLLNYVVRQATDIFRI